MLRRFSRWLWPLDGREARPARKKRARTTSSGSSLLNCPQLPASLEIDLLRGAVMDRLRVSLPEVVGLARLGNETSWPPHLPYVSPLPGELCAAGPGLSEGRSLAAWCSSCS